MNKVLLFDCFGVIFDEVSEIWFGRHFSSDKIQRIESTIATAVNINNISGDEFYRELSVMSGVAPSQIEHEWMELAKTNSDVVSLIEHYHTNHKIGLVSNGFNPFVRSILRKNNLEKCFDDIIISCEVKVCKPDPRIFALAMERLQTSPAESIFIDDRPENVSAAKSFGIDGILYESSEQLTQDLLECGVV